MKCPSCGKTVAESAWICGFCDHILDPSVLGDVYEERAEPSQRARLPSVREERTSLIAWTPKPEDSPEEVPDAMILGEPDDDDVRDSQIMRGAAQSSDGRTATYLFYASGATSRIVHPDAIPRITGGDITIPRTPYEDFILSQIDGVRSVREIHRTSGLAPQEVVVTLLTLLDKGAIRIDGVAPESRAPKLRELDEELEKTQAIQRPVSNERRKKRKKDLDDLIDAVEAVSRMLPLARSDSFSDVWAEPEPDATVSADELIEEEQEEIATELGEDEVTNTIRAASARKKSARNERSDTKPPSRVDSIATIEEEAEAKTVVPPDELDILELPTKEDPPPSRTPVPLMLDPSFLVEVAAQEWGGNYDEDPVVAPIDGRRESSGKRRKVQENQRRVLQKAVKRAPVQERKRSQEEVANAPGAAPQKQPSVKKAPAFTPIPGHKAEPIDSVNMLKAQKLFDQALKDKADGNLVSARMNMKLAMTFDTTNELYAQAFDELSKNPDAQVKSNGPTGKSRARELYDQATEAENGGDVDRAITLLEQAIGVSKQAPFLNRLGVILAMKKREFVRAQQLVEHAIELAPDNSAYEKNLQKILSMAATSDMRKQTEDRDKDNKKGLLGLLGRRK